MSMNILLRRTKASDLDLVLSAEQHPDNCNFVYQWDYQTHINALTDDNFRHYVITNPEHEFLGYVILDNVKDSSNSINLRRLVVTRKGESIGKQTLRLIQKLAFEELNAHRLWLDVFVDNQRAYNLYKQVGFREEGKLIESYLRNNQYRSQYIMAILKREYHALTDLIH